ncbi:hypothetical protein Vretifemale_5567 [Volvox reticuliferus]|nr:hypothetical protein Vretifemale_5567 [Volvox reticuliferus]
MGLTVEEHLKSTLKAQLGLQQDASVTSTTGSGAGHSYGGKLPPLRGSSKGRTRSGSGDRSANVNGAGTVSSTGQRVGDIPAFPSMVEVAGRTVPTRYSLRQAADFEAVHREALMEEKIHRGEMLSHHPQAFTNALGSAKAPFFDLQTNRNLLPYEDPYDPTIGTRGPRFTPIQQSISRSAFNRYIKRQHIFDKDMAAEAY